MDLHSELLPILCSPTHSTSGGYPYLQEPAFVRLRDWVPHLLGWGPKVLEAVDTLVAQDPERERAGRVVRQVVRTAAVTAPSDLWLLRHVLDALREMGVLRALAQGVVLPEGELRVDFSFLLSRGYLVRSGRGFRLADHSHARGLLELPALPISGDLVPLWSRALSGDSVPELDTLSSLRPGLREPGLWFASPSEIQLGWALVPLVLAMHTAGKLKAPPAGEAILAACGLGPESTELRERVLSKGPGPFGIIHAYHPYMAQLPRILQQGRGSVHVSRSANVAASQVANARSFRRSNDALDSFCEKTGHRYSLFIEHALGRGEATRQRWRRGPEGLSFVGADLEQASLDAAREQQALGRLPADMRFVQADIGQPQQLLAGLKGLQTQGAVMVVGNGFHEIRGGGDQGIVDALSVYEEAGLILLFTEESALAVDDLLYTGWNTYHAGFKYVHERSGQGLRPATPPPPSALQMPLSASWTECAQAAGYWRADPFCVRSRRIYPYTPTSGHNPAISVNHFFVPRGLAVELGLLDG